MGGEESAPGRGTAGSFSSGGDPKVGSVPAVPLKPFLDLSEGEEDLPADLIIRQTPRPHQGVDLRFAQAEHPAHLVLGEEGVIEDVLVPIVVCGHTRLPPGC